MAILRAGNDLVDTESYTEKFFREQREKAEHAAEQQFTEQQFTEQKDTKAVRKNNEQDTWSKGQAEKKGKNRRRKSETS